MKRLLTVAAAGALVLGVTLPSAAAETTHPMACNLIANDTASLLTDAPVIQTVVGMKTIDPTRVTAARKSLGCGAPPDRTAAQAKQAVCSALTVQGIQQLLDESNASDQVRALVASNQAAENLVIKQARQQLGCDVVPPTPAPTTSVGTPHDPSTTASAPSTPHAPSTAHSQVAVIPQGAPATGAA